MTAARLRPALIGAAAAAVAFGVLAGGFTLGQQTAPAAADTVRNGNHDTPKYASRGGDVRYYSDWVEMAGGKKVRCITATDYSQDTFGVSCDWPTADR
ncbi:hypothetical protein [Curtobacterium sp. MCSS17_016]|uniref:hypothetical protein n=1 Tax=Curtobacterium sp. MCSS17_016 TaxID=2175644 RepID=UPI000DA7C0BE|nr:hypothetical protein [Curtobacterium sp. MCSS17_016]WIE81017.1 hypothetical protein DEJ19_021105 [Curtobacterium sp. MCSS17_016]